ncbi:MAG TPA: CBS domain-containing protein [Pyrinomonadaceae bacterium]|nr:CBS domain-containing protein [Pyrinomonadaceae bacterium]HMP64385.1 CBS domain-containing protein [Pyrinomonadaceae bacterium]
MNVEQIMSKPVIKISEDASLQEAATLMLENGIGCLPVVGVRGKIVGVVTESSFTAKEKGVPFSTFRAPQLFGRWLSEAGVEKIYAEARTTRVGDVMSAPAVTVEEHESINRAVELMLEHDINRIPVVKDGEPVGVVARHDMLRLLAASEL